MKNKIISFAVAGTILAASANAQIKIDSSITPATLGYTGGSGLTVNAITGAPNNTEYLELNLGGGEITLTSAQDWILDTAIFITDGCINIEAGTCVRGEPRTRGANGELKNDAGSLVITRTGYIDAQGTAADPIVFTTAAVDNDGNGVADGVIIDNVNVDLDNFFFVKSADQWTPGDLFLDADPKNNPLCPTVDFDQQVPGVAPSQFLDVNANGNPEAFVEIVSENRSLWGGIIILGNAPTSNALIRTNTADGEPVVADTVNGDLGDAGIATGVLDDPYEGFVEGLNITDLGELGVYGGINAHDNSGCMRFVSIRHGGAAIFLDDPDGGNGNEINGLTMGGVGRGTLIENIEVYCNGDDGYEWFGGNVDTKFLISLWNNDDSFDIDEGFQGQGQFWFSLQGDDTINGDHGGEHDGTDANHDAVGFGDSNAGGSYSFPGGQSDDDSGGVVPTFVTVCNATYIGGGEFGNKVTDSGANRALRIRDSYNGIYIDSIFYDFKDEPVRGNDGDNVGYFTLCNISAYDSVNDAAYALADLSFLDGGTTAQATNWVFDGVVLDEDVFQVRREGFFLFPGFPGNVDPVFGRRGCVDGNVGLDPRPDASAASSVLVTKDKKSKVCFFTSVPYRGAFSNTDNDDSIWTGSAASGSNPAWSVFGKSFLQIQ